MRSLINTERVAPWLACVCYGAWAAFSNAEHSVGSMITAFMVQGGFAFVSTWLLARFIGWLIQQQQPDPRYPLVFMQCAIILIAVPATLHLAAGTPDIVEAMLPGVILGNGYAGLLIYRKRL